MKATIMVPIVIEFKEGVKPSEVRDAINGIGCRESSSAGWSIDIKPSVTHFEVRYAMKVAAFGGIKK